MFSVGLLPHSSSRDLSPGRAVFQYNKLPGTEHSYLIVINFKQDCDTRQLDFIMHMTKFISNFKVQAHLLMFHEVAVISRLSIFMG